MAQIIAVGHSITAGQWDTEGGWVQRLRKFLDTRALRQQDEDLINYVYNLGVGGDTSREMLDRMENELKARYEKDSLNIVLIQVGENDIQSVNDEIRVGKDEFRSNLEDMISIAYRYAEEIVLVGAFPADPELDKVPHSGGKKITDERRKEYEEIKKEVAEAHELPFIDLYPLRKEDIHESTEEGIHPTDRGHERIYEEVRGFLLDNYSI